MIYDALLEWPNSVDDLKSLPISSFSRYLPSNSSSHLTCIIKVRNLDPNAGRYCGGKYVHKLLDLYVTFGIQYYFDRETMSLRQRVIYIEKIFYWMTEAEREQFSLMSIKDLIRLEAYVREVLKRGSLFKGHEVRSIVRL